MSDDSLFDPWHLVPYYGYFRALDEKTEQYESGDITAWQYYGYMSGLSTVSSWHIIHTAAHSESGFGLAAVNKLRAIPFVAFAAVPITLAGANQAVIEAAPQEQQKGLWQMFSSALTGTFGIGSALDL